MNTEGTLVFEKKSFHLYNAQGMQVVDHSLKIMVRQCHDMQKNDLLDIFLIFLGGIILPCHCVRMASLLHFQG